MDIQFTNVPSVKPSLLMRLAAAYRAFTMTVHPDMSRVLDEIKKLQEVDEADEADRRTLYEDAVNKLNAFDKATIESIAARTNNWHLLFDPAMTAVEALDTPDQLTIVRYLFSENRHIVRQLAFRNWMSRHADAIMDALEEEGH